MRADCRCRQPQRSGVSGAGADEAGLAAGAALLGRTAVVWRAGEMRAELTVAMWAWFCASWNGSASGQGKAAVLEWL